jgi:D-alanine-D-alanine ligase
MINNGTVLILFNTPDGSTSAFAESEIGVMEQVRAVADALKTLGMSYREIRLKSLRELPFALSRNASQLAINLVEGFPGAPADAFLVPAVCRALGIEVTGNDTPCLALSTDKTRTKAILSAAGIRCPAGAAVQVGQEISLMQLPGGLCIVKPAAADASEGIDAHSIIDSSDPKLGELVREIHEKFKQPAIVEEMIGQREINVSLLQMGDSVKVLPLAEIDFSAFGKNKPRIVGYAAKWKKDSFEYSNTRRTFHSDLPESLRQRISEMALVAWRTLGCRDYVRVDFRLTEQNEPVVLEVNANPDISPDAGFAAALQEAGISYSNFVKTLLDNALSRADGASDVLDQHENAAGLKSDIVEPVAELYRQTVAKDCDPPKYRETKRFELDGGRQSFAAATFASGPVQSVIRRAVGNDREAVLALLNQPEFFRPDELEIAREVFDDAVKGGEHGHYQSFVIEAQGQVGGWICYGPTPCALGTFDIYWIAVAAKLQGRGLGKELMGFVERMIRVRGGRLAVIETSGRSAYDSTRNFYERLGYSESARLKDFYSPGDDKVVSIKTL